MDPAVVWEGTGPIARTARLALAPAAWLYRGGVWLRNALFDAGVFHSGTMAVPALSVGNLTVGGTGKTPVAADLARRLRDGGGRPALVLRGYGADEPAVHALLNPDVPVLTSPDRVAASARARELGCDVVVLDDAFQHRWAQRMVDLVVVAAEQWCPPMRCLPAGPYREPPAALRRATLVVVTRKSASESVAADVERAIARFTPAPVTRVALQLDMLRRVGDAGAARTLESLHGASVVAVAGIGAPRRSVEQLEGVGARVELVSFPDHHRFTPDDVAAILRRSPAAATVVCTLKDAVKLEPLWPRASPPLWYVSQRLAVEAGADAYAAAVQRLLDARWHDPTLR
ncbi:MAG: tetraacyldisaccharide 4'-kinase [Gemmatimonadota bacterium]